MVDDNEVLTSRLRGAQRHDVDHAIYPGKRRSLGLPAVPPASSPAHERERIPVGAGSLRPRPTAISPRLTFAVSPRSSVTLA